MKKGFTLVELAIVLVVIGLLMGMAFKGKSLVDAARIKADVNKVQKLSTAINVYYSKYDTLPGRSSVPNPAGGTAFADNSSAAIYQTLINEGLVKDSDFKASSGATYWVFTGCGHTNNSWALDNISETSNLCIYRSTSLPTTYNTRTNAISGQNISGVTICQLETLLDDKNLTTGDGRQVTGQAVTGVDTTDWNCAKTSGPGTFNDITNGSRQYLMRIF